MKLHLPAKLVRAVLACCTVAAFSYTAIADVPSGYRTITISNANQLASYTDTDYTAFLISASITDSSYRICGDHQYWSGTTANTKTLNFSSFDSETRGTLCVENDLTMEKFKNLTFDLNVSHTGSNWDYMGFQGGAAVCGNYSSSMVFSDNTAVTFSRNSAEWDGGAVCGGDVDFRGNGTLTFTENAATCGGALYSGGYPLDDWIIPNGINIESNDVVDFTGNSARMGGAIFEDSAQALSIAGNGNVNFEGNRSEDLGGAIAMYNFTGREVDVTVSGNNQVSFTGNVAGGNGGCIYHSDGKIELSKNGSLSFTGNSAGGNGGALYGSDIAVTGNGGVVFSGNTSPGAASVPDVVTLNDFRKAKKEFHMLALGHVSIVPEEPIAGAQGANDDTVYVRGSAEFFGATYDCEFTYRTDERYGEDGTFYEPAFATLWVTFEHLNAITDSSVLATMGMDPQGAGMTGATLELQFNFSTHEVEVMTSTQGTVTINYPDPMGEYITFNAWLRSVLNANFYISKQGTSERAMMLTGYGDLVNNGGGAVYVTESGNLLVEDNDIVEFSNNNAVNDGGAICGEYGSTITISGNPTVSFIQNTAGSYGGAIAVYDNCLVSVAGNGSVVFDGNSAQENGGAIYGKSSIDIVNNGSVGFSANWASENGGAICGWDTASIALRGNTSVEFSENAAAQRGGAVYGSDIAIANNGSVVFSGNCVPLSSLDYQPAHTCGGALYGVSVSLTHNDGLTFSGNSGSYGGAVGANEMLSLTDNSRVTFTGNSGNFGGAVKTCDLLTLRDNDTVSFSGNSAEHNGGAIQGDAIGTIMLSWNGDIVFESNSSGAHGGAVCADGELDVSNNSTVSFVENSAVENGGALNGYMNSRHIFSDNGTLSFVRNNAVARGGAIHENSGASISLKNNATVEFTGNIAGENGGAVYGPDISITNNGSVVFSGNSAAGEQYGDFVVTLNDFRKCKKEFHMLALGHVSIVPEEPIAGAQGAGDDTAYVRGSAEFFGAAYNCDFVYRTDERYGEDGTPVGEVPATFNMIGS